MAGDSALVQRGLTDALRDPELLLTIIEQLPFVTYAVRFDTGAPVYISPQIEQVFGYSVDEWIEETPSFEESLYARLLHPDDRERVLRETRDAHSRGETFGGEYRMIGRDGRVICVRDVSTVVRDEEGRPLMSQGIFLDVTAEKEAEAERERLQAELRQAQKLEAIGRLAGGVAHDFNNVLTAIRGYSEFLAEGLPEGTTLRADAEEIRRAADRAGGLTRQLLAFSRRQMLQVQCVDVNEVVSDMDKLLRRLIGADIELVTLLAPELAHVEADLGQLEQVIINLALNARDAMPSGGRLVIQTANVTVTEPVLERHPSLEPGEYVTLTVRDSGIGMADTTTSHIFEPFFTTKDLGKGTGLGLSTVYGIVEQSGGRIFVYSDPGRGTTFKIYLPASETEGLPSTEPTPVVSSVRGSETILLVEDDEVLRTLAARTLREQGYQVLEARYASEALELSSKQLGDIDALVSDVVMPGMSGVELAERLASERPGIRIVLMSGFTDEAVAHHTHAQRPVAFLDKPFPPSKLLRVVRKTLENPVAASSENA